MFVNIDSSIPLARGTEEYTASYLGYLSSIFSSVKKYLVSPETMDILYPPRKRYSLNDECLKEILKNEECAKNMEYFWYRCAERCIGKTNAIVAVGLYMPNIPSDIAEKLNLSSRPSIFICPERVRNWSDKVSTALKISTSSTEKIIATMVILHELAHAYMDGGNSIGHFYEQVIEESLANAVAYDLLSSNTRGRAVLRYAMSLQPLEYRAYVFWQYKSTSTLPGLGILKLWRERGSDFYRDKAILKSFYWHHCFYDPDYYYYHRRELYELLNEGKNGWQTLAFYILQSVV